MADCAICAIASKLLKDSVDGRDSPLQCFAIHVTVLYYL